MDIRAVDTRDQTWEISQPKYRVYFQDENGATDEYKVEGAEVAEVMAWAEAQRNGRTIALYACVPHCGLGLLRVQAVTPRHANRGRLVLLIRGRRRFVLAPGVDRYGPVGNPAGRGPDRRFRPGNLTDSAVHLCFAERGAVRPDDRCLGWSLLWWLKICECGGRDYRARAAAAGFGCA
ncbi:MAG: hypothetical protein QOI90_985 [Mycobacterium sp.]|nr:hypothetical protein [Mycobacterium sp.]